MPEPIGPWHEHGYELQWRATTDPRILEVIERQADNSLWPDGDGLAPAYWFEYRGGWSASRAGSTFDDEDAADAIVTAWNTWGRSRSDIAERYLRIFHGIEFVELQGPSQGDLLVLIDGPAFREHIGYTGTEHGEAFLGGDIEMWQAYIDGDVWAIGHAVLEERTTDETPVDINEQDWDMRIESYGYYGTAWARESLADVEWPALDPMLPTV